MSFDDARQVLEFDYRVMTFLVSLGIIQLAAARSSLTGLWLVTGRRAVRNTGRLLVAAGLMLYFLLPLWQSGPWATADDPTTPQGWHTAPLADLPAAHNISDTMGGLSGNTQAVLLITSAVVALLIAALFGAWTVRRLRTTTSDVRASGIEALAGGNLAAAIRSAWSITRRRGASPDQSPARAGPGGPS